jgi:glycosyltransferase involved in cell wall biosynthesis
VYVSGGSGDTKYVAGLYTASNCFVLPTRGEGFGLPYLEAAACAIPSIATGWGGQIDFLSSDNALLIDYEMTDIPLQILPYFRNYAGGKWAEPSVDSLRKHLRWAVEHPTELMQLGFRAFDVAQNYSVNVVGLRAAQRIKEIWDGVNGTGK